MVSLQDLVHQAANQPRYTHVTLLDKLIQCCVIARVHRNGYALHMFGFLSCGQQLLIQVMHLFIEQYDRYTGLKRHFLYICLNSTDDASESQPWVKTSISHAADEAGGLAKPWFLGRNGGLSPAVLVS